MSWHPSQSLSFSERIFPKLTSTSLSMFFTHMKCSYHWYIVLNPTWNYWRKTSWKEASSSDVLKANISGQTFTSSFQQNQRTITLFYSSNFNNCMSHVVWSEEPVLKINAMCNRTLFLTPLLWICTLLANHSLMWQIHPFPFKMKPITSAALEWKMDCLDWKNTSFHWLYW